jgi:hypothetical protein
VATYYVNGEGGNDTHAGTSESTAWKSLYKVVHSTFSPGDKILFKGGISPEQQAGWGILEPPSNGTSGDPITFGSYGTGKAILLPVSGEAHIFLSNASWLVFEDLILDGSSINDPTYVSGTGGILTHGSGTGVHNIVVKNCEFKWCVSWINNARAEDINWAVESNVMEHSGDSGILNQNFPTGWVIEHNTFKAFGESSAIQAAGRHGIYARLSGPKIKFNIFEANTLCNGQCISQRGPNFEVIGNVLKASTNSGCIAYFPYTEERGTSLHAYNKCSGAGVEGWYCTSSESGAGDIGESFIVCNNTFNCPECPLVVNPDFRNAARSGNTSHLATMKFVFCNNIVNGGSGTSVGLYKMVTQATGELATYKEDHNLYGTVAATQHFQVYQTSYTTYASFHSGLGGAHDLNTSPGYASTETFALERTSPAINAGTTAVDSSVTYVVGGGGKPFEYVGSEPDIGAVEFTAPQFTAHLTASSTLAATLTA